MDKNALLCKKNLIPYKNHVILYFHCLKNEPIFKMLMNMNATIKIKDKCPLFQLGFQKFMM